MKLMAATSSDTSNTSTSFNNIKQNRVYDILLFFFGLSHIQGLVALWSHALVDTERDSLLVTFLVWDNCFMRLHVFGLGIFVLCYAFVGTLLSRYYRHYVTTSQPTSVVTSSTKVFTVDYYYSGKRVVSMIWMILMSTLLRVYFVVPVTFLTIGVWYDLLTFTSLAGQILSTTSLLVVLFLCMNSHHQYLPTLFCFSWISLSIVPPIMPDCSNDKGHTIATSMIVVPLY